MGQVKKEHPGLKDLECVALLVSPSSSSSFARCGDLPRTLSSVSVSFSRARVVRPGLLRPGLLRPGLRAHAHTLTHAHTHTRTRAHTRTHINPRCSRSRRYRQYLGKFGVSGSLALQRIGTLSGGQKSRVSLAMMCWGNPNILILDEPTNHLDLETIEAMASACRAFSGGIVVVSHDQHFLTAVCDEYWCFDDQKVTQFEGDFNVYKKACKRALQRTALEARKKSRKGDRQKKRAKAEKKKK